MKIQLRFFASIREALGVSEESVALPDHVQTVGDVRAFLCERGDAWSQVLADGRSLRMAYNHVMTDPETRLTDACEVAFFPPVTGG